jgi:hypothetical protein
MTDTSTLDAFLARIGPLAAVDHAVRQRHAAEEAPEFHALSFFHSRETIVSQIIGYLLRPTAEHGQGQLFLKAFMEALDLKCESARSVTIQVEPPCYTLSSRRRMDILIRFVTNGAENILAIESKSHFAGDQDAQVRDYLAHLRKAYPHASLCRLCYLNNGNAPDEKSITNIEWDSAVSDGRCKACNFQEVMSKWLATCCRRLESPKIRIFLGDFAAFIGIKEEKTMEIGNEVRTKVFEILENRRSTQESISPDCEAIMAMYALHLDIWQRVFEGCMQTVRELLVKQLSEWKVTEPPLKNGEYYFEMRLSKQHGWTTAVDGTPNLHVVLATEDYAPSKEQRESRERPTYLVVYVSKAEGFQPKRVEFNKNNIMRVDNGKYPYDTRLILSGVEDLRSEAGLRYLLDSQSSMDIASEVVGFIKHVQPRMETCFHPTDGQGAKPRHP